MAAPIDLHEVAEREREERFRTRWRVKACGSTACLSAGAGATIAAMEEESEKDDMALEVQVIPTGCMGLCSAGPLVKILRRGGDNTLYQKVTPEAGVEILRSHVENEESVPEYELDQNIPFFTSQERVVLANGGVINPDRIESYVAHGGYAALEKALTTMKPKQVIDELRKSGVRGRGGAGYPLASKWSLLAAAAGDEKFVVANGDEGSFVHGVIINFNMKSYMFTALVTTGMLPMSGEHASTPHWS